jgi:endogenous inhibitor of DNA gyrase (YacG/DUF329 family)
MNNSEKEKVSELRRFGWGYKKIAAEIGVSEDAVKGFLRRNRETLNPVVCELCGKPAGQTPHRKKKRFCSDKCRNSWWSAHPEARVRQKTYGHICGWCGKPFESIRQSSVYCSRECYANARRKENISDE